MTPKEKALELVKIFIPYTRIYNTKIGGYVDCNIDSKQCALIAVDEIINALRKDLPEIGLGKGFWHDVKTEIENL